MELDDLKQRWTQLDQKLDAAIHFNTHLLAQAALERNAETALRRLSRWLWAGLVLNVVAALWLGSFIADHITQPRFWLPAAGLHVGIIALILVAIHQLRAIAQVDFAAPIVAIQKRLEWLRLLRIRATMATLLLSPLLWTPLLIVGLKGFFGVDAYASFSTAWLWANMLVGVLIIPIGTAIARRYADRLHPSPLLQRLLRDIAGRNLSAANDYLQSLRQFEEEPQGAGRT